MRVKVLCLLFCLFHTYTYSIEIETLMGSVPIPGFAVNSHLIKGKKQAILVDGQFTLTEAKRVADWVKRSQKELKQIFITHGHPDHYFGIEAIYKVFPKAEIIATKNVLEYIRTTWETYLKEWQPNFPKELPKTLTFIDRIKVVESLTLDGETFPFQSFKGGECDHSSIVYIKSLKALITGDIIISHTHLWLADEPVENRPKDWLKQLKQLETFDVEVIYPGHGPNDTTRVIDENRQYLNRFLNVVEKSKDRKAAFLAMMKQPLIRSYWLPEILTLSLEKWIEK